MVKAIAQCEVCEGFFERRAKKGVTPRFCYWCCPERTTWLALRDMLDPVARQRRIEKAASWERQGPRPPCSIAGCGKSVEARGWCSAHYNRWKRHGSPTARMRGEVVDGKRICCACGEDKPWSEEFFYSSKHHPGGLTLNCKDCARERRRQYHDEYYELKERSCRVCGVSFVERSNRSAYCSDPCASVSYAEQNAVLTLRRRALLYDAWVEDVKPLTVYERDGWRCGICGDVILPFIRHPHPRSASVDHIVPLARGGEHSYVNCQASHLGCNCSKSDRVSDSVA